MEDNPDKKSRLGRINRILFGDRFSLTPLRLAGIIACLFLLGGIHYLLWSHVVSFAERRWNQATCDDTWLRENKGFKASKKYPGPCLVRIRHIRLGAEAYEIQEAVVFRYDAMGRLAERRTILLPTCESASIDKRTYDMRGRLSKEELFGLSEEEPHRVIEHEYDSQGRETVMRHRWDLDREESEWRKDRTEVEYDDHGRIVLEKWDMNVDGKFDRLARYHYSEDGNLMMKE